MSTSKTAVPKHFFEKIFFVAFQKTMLQKFINAPAGLSLGTPDLK